MPTLFWDASALAKRYVQEVGSDVVETIFDLPALPNSVSTPWGYSETFALLRRRQNDKRLTAQLFQRAISLLRSDLLDGFQFLLVTVTDVDIIRSVVFIQRHNINATDAALLATLLRYARTTGETCLLVAADSRFCRAAKAEGLGAINPEMIAPADIPALIASR